MNISDPKKQPEKTNTLRRLDTDNTNDFQMIERFAVERIPVSSILGVKNNEHLLFFYLILAFNDAIYYIEEIDVIVIFKKEDAHLHIFDIISKKRVEIETILSRIVSAETEIINFYFTPDYASKNIHTEFITESDDTLFVRPLLKDGTKHFLFPLTSHS